MSGAGVTGVHLPGRGLRGPFIPARRLHFAHWLAGSVVALIIASAPTFAQTAPDGASGVERGASATLPDANQSTGVDESSLFGEVQPVQQVGGTGGGASQSAPVAGAGAPESNGATTTASPGAGGAAAAGPSDASAAPADAFLLTRGVEWGGMLTSSVNAGWTWTGGDTFPDIASAWPVSTFSTTLKVGLYFDARPTTSFRVFGKLNASYPFLTNIRFPATSPVLPGVTLTVPNITVFELFSDFTIANRVFFRAGKQTVKWGVGYYFSPADVLSLAPIDPQNPTEEREGPPSVKTEVPIGLNTLTVYMVDNNVLKPEDLALAAKLDLVIGGWELSIGGFYQRNLSPRAVVMATGSIWRFNLFAEAVASYGSDRVFLSAVPVTPQNPFGLDTTTYGTRLFASATAGFTLSFPDQYLTFIAQYFYHGEGYDSSSLLGPALGALATSAAAGTSPGFTTSDVANFGRHYIAASGALTKIGSDDLGASVFWLANMSDLSGIVKPALTLTLNDYLGFSAGLTLSYGKPGDELAPAGMTFGTFLGATLGTGAF